MKKEIEFLQGAFESYKSSLHQDMDDKWNKREDDLMLQLQEDKQAAVHEMSKINIKKLCIVFSLEMKVHVHLNYVLCSFFFL